MTRIKELKFSLPTTGKGLFYLAVAILLFGWLLNTPPGLLGKADAVGYAVCHRIDLRSFHLGDRTLPLCARCTGMFLAAMLGLIYQAILRPRRAGMPPWSVLAVLVILAGSFAVDGLNSYMHLFPGAPSLYEPHNWSRLLTGSGMGLAVSVVLFPAINQTIWKEWYTTPGIKNLGSMGILIAITLVMDAIVLTENPFALYPLALVSAAGVIILLTLVYTMVWLMIFRAENSVERFQQLLLPLVGGFGFALLQIIMLDLVRYLFTGTWDGFHLG